ncbi:uncharacterized protein METZ01_LOCUS263339, partial [marine metagenome]
TTLEWTGRRHPPTASHQPTANRLRSL